MREVTSEGGQGPDHSGVGPCHAGRSLDSVVRCKEGSVVKRGEWF